MPKRDELDGANWRPSASLDCLHLRARLLAGIRAFFRARGVLEVETPICSQAAVSDPALDSLRTSYSGPGAPQGRQLFLHTSPEFAMKRLLAAGSGPIFQICKVFRDGELGRYHNPEFTLLEWYRPGMDYRRLMDEVAALIRAVLPAPVPEVRYSYRALFQRHLDVDPFNVPLDHLPRLAAASGVSGAGQLQLDDRDAWLDLLLSHCIEPALGSGICFVYDYPPSQASLARVRPDSTPVAERFELYLDGVELANGFQELTDATEQRQRFEVDLQRRASSGRPHLPLDERFLAALAEGLPECSGVALGIDRLLMRLAGAERIDQVLAFPLHSA